jgi:hypothetical protein
MHYLEPVIGGIAAFLLGFAWYTALFGKVWQAETGITEEEGKKGVGMTHGLALLMMIFLSYGVNKIIGYHDEASQTFMHGALHGFLAALSFCVPAIAINYLYQKKSLKLFLIDAAYVLAFLALSGGVMAALKIGEKF